MKMQTKDFALSIKELSEDGTFEGYGSVFNNQDYGGDIVAPGAFTDSINLLKKKERALPVLWQHNSDNPIGVYDEFYEDAKGLYVKGRLLLTVQRGKEAYDLLKAGAVTGLSIGYGVQKYEMDTETYVRTLTELELYEVSLVTFPMNDDARVSAVKERIAAGVLPTLKQFEEILREAGFSKSQATAIAGGGLKKLLRSESAPETEAKELADVLQNFKLPT